MKFTPTLIPDILIIEPNVITDIRGFFLETYHYEKFQQAGINLPFVQDNHSQSMQGTLRGLHYQLAPCSQGKLVRVLQGEIFDVGVDLRIDSPTQGKWVGEHLSSSNFKMLYIPPGCAHGFYVLSQTAEVFYKCTDIYAPKLDRGIRWNDPILNISWPLINNTPPLLSTKDQNLPLWSLPHD